MPFGGRFDEYYQLVIKPAIETTTLRPRRADEIYGTNPIISDIWRGIWTARLIVADVTTKNPNVNYELGLAHALGVPTILITQRMEDVPFDYRHRRCIPYDVAGAKWQDELQNRLVKTIEVVLGGESGESHLPWPYDARPLTPGGVAIDHVDPRQLLLQGAGHARTLIARAYGPHGSMVAVPLSSGETVPRNQGLAIIEHMRATVPMEQVAVERARQVAELVTSAVGDGSKTAILLFEALLRAGLEAINGPHLPTDVVRGMSRAVQQVLAEIDGDSQPLSREAIPKVISTACREPLLTDVVGEAFARAGSDGIVAITSGLGNTTQLRVSSGMQIDRGYVSEKFVNQPSGQNCSFEDCLVLITDHRINQIPEILPVLNQVAALKKPLLVVSDELGDEVLQTLLVNNLRGTLPCVAIRCPGSAESRTNLLQDLAIFTGGRAVTRDLGTAVGRIAAQDLGQAGRVTVDRDRTTIAGGKGDKIAVQYHIERLRTTMATSKDPYEKEKLHLRLTNIAGQIATIHIARPTPSELEDAKYRAQAGMHSAKTAIERGYVVGGGAMLFRGAERVRLAKSLSEADRCGVVAVATALEAPLRVLAQKAELDVDATIEGVRARVGTFVGLNAATGVVEDLAVAGVLDSASMLHAALEIAFSQAKTLLLTDSWDKRDVLSSQTHSGQDDTADLADERPF